MVSTVRSYSDIVLNTVQKSMNDSRTHSKVTMEFGLQAGGETGVPFVTKRTAQANVKVTTEWDLSRGNQGTPEGKPLSPSGN